MWTSAGFLRRLSMSWVCSVCFTSTNRLSILFISWDNFLTYKWSNTVSWSLHPVLQTRLPLKHLHGNEPRGQLEQINKTVHLHPSSYCPSGFQISFPHYSHPIPSTMDRHFSNLISSTAMCLRCFCGSQPLGLMFLLLSRLESIVDSTAPLRGWPYEH